MKPNIRWMIRRDMPEVLDIERRSFEFPWSKDDFIRCLRQRNCIGFVAEHDDRVVGAMVYELHQQCAHLLNFSVHPEERNTGIGAAMLNVLKDKLSPKRRAKIVLELRESNIAAQMWFHSQGFRATEIIKGLYNDTPEDAYRFEYEYDGTRELASVGLFDGECEGA